MRFCLFIEGRKPYNEERMYGGVQSNVHLCVGAGRIDAGRFRAIG